MRLDDLPGDACEHCHGEIPVGRRIDAIFCSDECRTLSKQKLLRDALLAEKVGRICGRCGTEMAANKRADAIYCSRSCTGAAGKVRYRARAKERRAVAQICASALVPPRARG